MRKLSFTGFLKQYIKDVSGLDTLSIHKLVLASKKNYRMVDSLLLYCVFTDSKDLLNKYSNNKYFTLMNELNRDNFLDNRYQEYDFQKIWEAYENSNKKVEYENEFKTKLREVVVRTMKEKRISNYRVYTDLKLNPGNVNDYLTNGNCRKVSLDVSKMIYRYVNECK